MALNPHTGQVLAVVGGRNYGGSQLNHAVAKRPTGSIFKPFVYAAAYTTSPEGSEPPRSDQWRLHRAGLASTTTRSPSMFDGNPYDPGNFEKGEFSGNGHRGQRPRGTRSTLPPSEWPSSSATRTSPTWHAVLASSTPRERPSVAIGTYSATPIDMAGAYTVFANNGVRHLKPWMLASVRNSQWRRRRRLCTRGPSRFSTPRTATYWQSLMEGAMQQPSAPPPPFAATDSTAPAAGKTGTSHDAWFAGYTSNLLCIVWVCNDDYRTSSCKAQRPPRLSGRIHEARHRPAAVLSNHIFTRPTAFTSSAWTKTHGSPPTNPVPPTTPSPSSTEPFPAAPVAIWVATPRSRSFKGSLALAETRTRTIWRHAAHPIA